MSIPRCLLKFQLLIFVLFVAASTPAAEKNDDHYVIVLNADLSGSTAQIGQAIQRGTQLAINEINERGGLLGKPLKLELADHRGNPARGIDNVNDAADRSEVIAIMGGLHTPVVLAELETIHDKGIVYLVPWAAGTPIIANGYEKSFVFRVSLRDEYAGAAMVQQALTSGGKRIGLLLEKTGWGRSNKKAMDTAASERKIEIAATAWFGWGEKDLSSQIETLQTAGCDRILLVSNPPEGEVALKAIAEAAAKADNFNPQVVSHWGIQGSGSDFVDKTGIDIIKALNLNVITTVDLQNIENTRIQKFLNKYRDTFGESALDQGGQPGVAHSYDAMLLLAAAVKQAGTNDSEKIRTALENLPRIEGLVRTYNPAFTKANHDALHPEDLGFGTFAANGSIVRNSNRD